MHDVHVHRERAAVAVQGAVDREDVAGPAVAQGHATRVVELFEALERHRGGAVLQHDLAGVREAVVACA